MVKRFITMLKAYSFCAHEAFENFDEVRYSSIEKRGLFNILAVHLEDMQRITFRDKDRLRSYGRTLPGNKNTTLTREMFAYNAKKINGNCLEVQTIKDVFYLTYKAACEALGLLGDDREWETTLEDACASTTFEQLRK
ncbi:hypothetical protein Tco_0092311 [Tanacetum coccineum]